MKTILTEMEIMLVGLLAIGTWAKYICKRTN